MGLLRLRQRNHWPRPLLRRQHLLRHDLRKVSSLLRVEIPPRRRPRILDRMLLRHGPRPGLHFQPNRLLHVLWREQDPNLRRTQPPQRVQVLRLRRPFAPDHDRNLSIPGLLRRTELGRASAVLIQLHQRDRHVRRVLRRRLRRQEIRLRRRRVR